MSGSRASLASICNGCRVQIVLVVHLTGRPDLAVDDLQTARHGFVLHACARGRLTVTVVVGVVQHPGVTVDGGNHGAVVMGLVILDNRITHGRLAPGVAAAVEHSHGHVRILGGDLNDVEQTRGGLGIGRAGGQEHLRQINARISAVDLDIGNLFAADTRYVGHSG